MLVVHPDYDFPVRSAQYAVCDLFFQAAGFEPERLDQYVPEFHQRSGQWGRVGENSLHQFLRCGFIPAGHLFAVSVRIVCRQVLCQQRFVRYC